MNYSRKQRETTTVGRPSTVQHALAYGSHTVHDYGTNCTFLPRFQPFQHCSAAHERFPVYYLRSNPILLVDLHGYSFFHSCRSHYNLSMYSAYEKCPCPPVFHVMRIPNTHPHCIDVLQRPAPSLLRLIESFVSLRHD